MSESFFFFGKHKRGKMLKLLPICLSLIIITNGAPTAKKTGKIFSFKYQLKGYSTYRWFVDQSSTPNKQG